MAEILKSVIAIGTGTWEGRFTKEDILDYCAGDVDALERLLERPVF